MEVKLRLGEHICPVCQRVFYIEDVTKWAYKYTKKRTTKYTCSWSCLIKKKPITNQKGA